MHSNASQRRLPRPAARSGRALVHSAVVALAFAWTQHPASAAEPIYWRHPVFYIPYQAASDPRVAADVKKIELMVSHGNVGDWTPLQEAEPHVRGFSYHAPADGEYSFARRLTDRRGNVSPAPIAQPQLTVVVDTKPPAIQLDALPDAAGRIVVRYEARDIAVRPESLRLETQTDGKTWQRTSLGPPDVSQTDRLLGQSVWRPPAIVGPVRFRVSLEDRAGNVGSAVANAMLAGSVPAVDPFQPSPAISSGPELGSPTGPSLSAPNASPVAAAAAPRFDAPANSSTATAPPCQNPYTSSTAVAAPVYSGAPPSAAPDRTPARLVADRTPSEAHPTPTAPLMPPPLTPPVSAPANEPGGDVPPLLNLFDRDAVAAAAAATPPTITSPSRPESPLIDGAWTAQSTQAPAAPIQQMPIGVESAANAVRWVNTQTFDLDYDLQTVGPWGVAKVELWGTRDAGQTWTAFGADPDNRGPMRVAVPSAGIYGFRLLVTGANGAPAHPPQAGDQPELLIGIDLEAPQVELQAAQLGAGELADHLIIRWNAADANLESRPVGLYFSGAAEGPWTMIASNLDNSGQYAWRLLRQVPEKFFLRLEVRDKAGNVTARQSASPVALNLPQPTGKFRNVRPVAEDPTRYRTAAGYGNAHLAPGQ
jgi:hypothetical protein